MNRVIIILFGLISLTSCKEFITTQQEAPQVITSNNLYELFADGQSNVLVNLKFKRLLEKNQEVQITTSHGHLVELPSEDYSTGNKTITCSPNSKLYSFVLVSSRKAQFPVTVSVKVNNLVTSKDFEFIQVCPNELIFDIDDQDISISSGERSIGTIDLLSNGQPTSDNIRVDFSINDSSLATVEPRIYFSESSPNTINIIPKGKEGFLELTAIVNQTNCTQLTEMRSIIIEE